MIRVSWKPCWMLAVTLVLLPALAMAAKQPKYGEFNPEHQSVEMFAAINQGDIDVRIIPKDSTECQVLIENKTDKPLNVKLPEAFGGVPVLAQFGGGGGGMGGGGGGSQGIGGGGMGGGGMGGMGGGGGGGFFNVPPEKVGKLQATTVCLEHGKKEPRAAIPYKVVPIEQITDKPAVQELCRMVGTGQLSQRAAQVAAWHLNNDMSFAELAAKRLRFANGASQPYFSPQELRAGMQITMLATKLAEKRSQTPSPGDSAISE